MTTNRATQRALRCLRRCAYVLVSVCAPGGVTQAEPAPAVQLSIGGEGTLPRDTHTALEVIVSLPPEQAEMPLALTPHIDGSAVELVRGRLLRADAKELRAGELHFAVPVVARSVGTAILRIDVLTYACDPACRRIDVHGARVLHVR